MKARSSQVETPGGPLQIVTREGPDLRAFAGRPSNRKTCFRFSDTGVLPINTHGGLLSEAYIHSVNHLYEAVEQIRGDAGSRQVTQHDTALVTGQLGYLSGYSSAIVLEGAR